MTEGSRAYHQTDNGEIGIRNFLLLVRENLPRTHLQSSTIQTRPGQVRASQSQSQRQSHVSRHAHTASSLFAPRDEMSRREATAAYLGRAGSTTHLGIQVCQREESLVLHQDGKVLCTSTPCMLAMRTTPLGSRKKHGPPAPSPRRPPPDAASWLTAEALPHVLQLM